MGKQNFFSPEKNCCIEVKILQPEVGKEQRTEDLLRANELLESEIRERKNVEDALRRSEEKYRALVENTSYVVYSVDTRGYFTYISPAIERFAAPYTANEFLGRHFSQFLHPDDLSDTMKTFESLPPGVMDPYEFRVKAEDGSVRFVQTSSRPIWEDGRMIGITGIMVDITARKRAETGLYQNMLFLQKLIDSISTPVFYKNRDGIYIGCNRAFEEMIGKTRDQIIGKNVYEVSLWELADIYKSADMELYSHPETQTYESKIKHVDGTIRDVIFYKALYYNIDGSAEGIIGTIVDITERKRIETKIRESEEMFRVLTETTSCAILIFRDYRVRYVNPAAERMLGFSKDEIQNMDTCEIASKVDLGTRNVIKSIHDKYLIGLPVPKSVEVKVLRKDGKYIWIDVSVGRIDYEGKPAMLVSAFEVTERKNSQEELSRVRDDLEIRFRERTSELKRTNEALRAEIRERKQAEIALTEMKMQAELYVDLMGHDINNLNQIALGNLELALEMPGVSGEVVERIEKPLEALKKSSRLINNVRKLQRIKTGNSHLKTMDLGKVVDDVHEEYSRIVDSSVTIRCSSIRGAYVMANELLSDVFSNLISNAIKHSHSQPEINIELTQEYVGDMKYYRVIVEDKGPGVPDELKKIIFDRLQRGQTRARGSGIGLHLVKTLIDEYNGRVWVEDRIPGKIRLGSRFVVLFPAADH